MPLLSYLLSNSLDDALSPVLPSLLRQAILDHHSADGHPRVHDTVMPGPIRAGHLHPWRHTPVLTNFLHPHHPHHHRGSVVPKTHPHSATHGFKVNLDVQQFTPDEISVKVVDGFVIVVAKHEERPDEHGLISREFTRRYRIPDGVDEDALTSTLSSDGILSIQAPKKSEEPPTKERAILITQTHTPAVTEQPTDTLKKSENETPTGEKMDQ